MADQEVVTHVNDNVDNLKKIFVLESNLTVEHAQT